MTGRPVRSSRSEEIRLRWFYRDLVMRGKTQLSLDAAKRLIGPDCAYHLYAFLKRKRRRS